MRTVLFICTGNTCRSPMAEAIARSVMAADSDEVFVASAGVGALDGMPTTHESLEALRHMGISHDGRSKRLTEQMIRKATLVISMTRAHQAAARSLVADSPEDQAKIVLLDPSGDDIEDPIGMGQREYDALARRFAAIIPERLKTLLAQHPDTNAAAASAAAPLSPDRP